MLFACPRNFITAVIALYSVLPIRTNATAVTAAPSPSSVALLSDNPPTCEFRTINYITDTLPQLCLKSSWSSNSGTVAAESVTASERSTTRAGEVESTPGPSSDNGQISEPLQDKRATLTGDHSASTTSTSISAEAGGPSPRDADVGELNDASFMSFEEWKKQALEKAGQKGLDIGMKKSVAGNEDKKRDSENIHNHLDSLGDDGEIELDFGGFGRGPAGTVQPEASHTSELGAQQESGVEKAATRRKDQYRSKDAGKTCKERFSYASFDAGATVLKTHSGAKNAKAVLVENKDSYMLSECAAENKFLIIELSEDIWIDTLVLANYEFFSSMIRTFRVSVSDRWPVKMEKWKDLGTYEARNSREIQAFLIENPQIWARYIRVEFLSHYGNEYYCPLSLVRVHGTRMLESWKEAEAASEEEELEEIEGQEAGEHYIPDAVAEVVKEDERLHAERKESRTAKADNNTTLPVGCKIEAGSGVSGNLTGSCIPGKTPADQITTPWLNSNLQTPAYFMPKQNNAVCLLSEAPSHHISDSCTMKTTSAMKTPETSTLVSSELVTETTASGSTSASQSQHVSSTGNATLQDFAHLTSDSQKLTNESSQTQAASVTPTSITANKTHSVTNSQKNKTSSISSASTASPTQQESFFKAVSRRLQLLETNSTLSLKYIEEQSKILREAFSKVEKKQLQKTTSFLQTLNSTVLTELQGFRQQYDEIWQSTIFSLQSQREESQREILAISSRLNILADEVIFQKRMSIIQSILLLLCLGLVIFSRTSSAAGHLDFSSFQSRVRGMSGYPMESPLESPRYRGLNVEDEAEWIEAEHVRQRSDESGGIGMGGRNYSPPTPISNYSGSDHSATPDAKSNKLRRRTTITDNSNASEFAGPSEPRSFLEPASNRSDDHSLSEASFSSSPGSTAPLANHQSPTPLASEPDTNNTTDNEHIYNNNTPSPGNAITTYMSEDQQQTNSAPSTPKKEKQELRIARKPLPALPEGGGT